MADPWALATLRYSVSTDVHQELNDVWEMSVLFSPSLNAIDQESPLSHSTSIRRPHLRPLHVPIEQKVSRIEDLSSSPSYMDHPFVSKLASRRRDKYTSILSKSFDTPNARLPIRRFSD